MTEQEKAKEIVALVASQFALTPEAMCGRARHERLAWPRQVAMALMREFTDLSLQQVAEEVGRSDHGTVLHAQRRVNERCAVYPKSRRALAELRGRLTLPVAVPASTGADW